MQTIKITIGHYQCLVGVDTRISKKTSGWDVERHCNANYEIHIAMSGNCVVDVEETTYLLNEGWGLLIAPGAYHCPKEISDDYAHLVISFIIQNSNAAQKFLENTYPCSEMRFSNFELILCKSIINEKENQMPYWRENIRAMYSILITSAFRELSHSAGVMENIDATYEDRRLLIIDDFFEQCLLEFGTEDVLAKKLGISRRQLNRVIKTNYGMTFREKLRCARMDRAAWLLRTTNLSTAKISETIGYISETSFFKAFKEHYKTTPSLYRRSMGDKRKLEN